MGDMTDQVKTKAAMNLLAPDLENWIRWGRDKSHYPKSILCILGRIAKSTEKGIIESAPEERRPEINILAAEQMEDAINRLPRKQRQAFLLYVLGRSEVSGSIKFARCRDDGMRVLRLGKSQYHNLVSKAFSFVLRQTLTLSADSGYSVPAAEKEVAGIRKPDESRR